MAGCRPICVEIITGTDREKWEYVRAFYYSDYESRDISDPSRIADEAIKDQQYAEDHAIWSTIYPHVPFEKFMHWYYEYGTYQYGNLPDYKKDDHVGHCFAPCPYDSNATELRTRHLLGLADNELLPTRVPHGIYYMKTESRGGRWGFECTYDSCPYYLANGRRYFYV